MLCVLAVFIPSFFMEGSARALFVPLSLAVGFAMVASYFLSSTFVPVVSVWPCCAMSINRQSPPEGEPIAAVPASAETTHHDCAGLMPLRWIGVPLYLAAALAVAWLAGGQLGREIFPTSTPGSSNFAGVGPPAHASR